jgi:hypothetical protein
LSSLPIDMGAIQSGAASVRQLSQGVIFTPRQFLSMTDLFREIGVDRMGQKNAGAKQSEKYCGCLDNWDQSLRSLRRNPISEL